MRSVYAPLYPNKYIEDVQRPSLLKWFIERNTQRMHMIFDEPISLGDTTQIYVVVATSLNTVMYLPAKSFFNVSYINSAKEAVISLDVICSIYKQCDLSSFLKQYPQGSLLLNFERSTAVYDLAAVPVPVTLLNEKMRETSSDCSLCPFGYWVSQKCTPETDRVCSPCQSCSAGTYASTQCLPFQDTQCSVCNDCPLGTYISTQCSAKSDTVCSKCNKCKALSFEFSACENGLDTVCATCKKCLLLTAQEKELCNTGDYFFWSQDQCCFDRNGKQTPCNQVDYQNMLLSARGGRRQWVFDTSYPDITGKEYQFPKAYS